MYKIAQVAHFLPELGPEAGRDRWCGEHAALGAGVPGVERYVQNFATSSLGLVGIHDSRPSFDGYACVWFADRAGFRSSVQSPQWSAMDANASSLLVPDPSRLLTAAVEEKLIIDGPRGRFKAVWFVQFTAEIRTDPDRTREAHEYWTRTHGGAFGVRVPGIDRYVQNHVVEPIVDGVELGYDGFSECWFQDRANFDVTMESKEWGEMNNDAKNIFDRDWIVGGWSSLLDEVIIKAG
jgi:uncharacterized protein (TIGR02118 family)